MIIYSIFKKMFKKTYIRLKFKKKKQINKLNFYKKDQNYYNVNKINNKILFKIIKIKF